MAQLACFGVFESVRRTIFYFTGSEHFDTDASSFAFCRGESKEWNVQLAFSGHWQLAEQSEPSRFLHGLDEDDF